MSQTTVAKSAGIAVKNWSEALFAMAVRAPTPINTLAGPAPTIDKASATVRRQSTSSMPLVRVNDLTQTAGDTVRLDCVNIVKLRPIMGDQNAEGRGAPLKFTYMDISIDMATLPVSAGGKMTQKRFQHDLRRIATAQLKGGIPSFLWQRSLTMMAGMRGEQDGSDWILPLATDSEFADMMVNPVQAPTYNRHYVIDANDLVQGGQQLSSIDSTDVFKLTHIDRIAALWDELVIKMQSIQIPGDPAAGDDPIKGVLLVDPLVWDSIITDTTAGFNIRTFQTNALERAKWGQMSSHPLFMGSPILWNGVLVKKMQHGIRASAGAVLNYISSANRYTGTETTVTVASIGAGYQISRSIFLSAQALGIAAGANQDSGVPYTMLENRTNYQRNLEMAGEIMGGEQKIRFSLPNETGQAEPTDMGILVIDSITKRLY